MTNPTTPGEFEGAVREQVCCGEMRIKQDETSIEKAWCVPTDLCPDCTTSVAAIVAAHKRELLKLCYIWQSDLNYLKGQLEGLGAPHNYVDRSLQLVDARIQQLQQEEK